MFVHHVFFWLANPTSKSDLDRLIEGLKTLSGIPAIRMHHIGMPAATDRDVIDRSYSVSWLTVFEDAEGQDAYQKDPIHLAFVESCSQLWSRVLVYDSVDFS